MTYPYNHQASGTNDRPFGETALDLDAFLVDDDFDDSLDREIFAIRESLADFRNV